MDAAALRQAYSAVPVVPVRADIYARRDAVSTELPVSQSVASTGDAAVQNDVSRNAEAFGRLAQYFQKPLEQRFERDRKTEVLVFKKVDPANGDVILQLPDQSLLNLRAYLKDQESLSRHGIEKTA